MRQICLHVYTDVAHDPYGSTGLRGEKCYMIGKADKSCRCKILPQTYGESGPLSPEKCKRCRGQSTVTLPGLTHTNVVP